MATSYECELLVSFAKTDEYREFFQVLLGRAMEEQRLRSELEKEILKERERKDGKPFQFSSGQQRMLARFEQDAAEAREQMKAGFSKFPTALTCSASFTVEKSKRSTWIIGSGVTKGVRLPIQCNGTFWISLKPL